MPIGKIRETHRGESVIGTGPSTTEPFSGVVDFEWTIHRLFSLAKNAGKYYKSGNVVLFGIVCFLKLYPNGIADDQGWIRLEFVHSFPGRKLLSYTFGVKKADGTKETIVLDQRSPECLALHKFLQKSDLLDRKSELAPSDELTITCTVRIINFPSAQGEKPVSCGKQTKDASGIDEVPPTSQEEFSYLDVKAVSALRKHLKDLLLAGDDHDVTLKVEDQKFRAHKNMLRVRSPVFAAMFRHEMEESTTNSISIEDCDPEAFGDFLLYIYTGQVENLTPTNVMSLYYAGDKYDVSELKEICVDFLKKSLSTTGICDVIVLAAKHGEDELLEHATKFFVRNTKDILITPEWRRFVRDNPDEANELYIKSLEKCEMFCTKRK